MPPSDSLPKRADFAVIGGGAVGASIALELKSRHPTASVVVLDKESRLGAHASGRNSGVLHAGFYYSADSLKARFTRDGNRRLTAWCEQQGVRVRRCGKLVVARNEAEHVGLDELLRRARVNGVPLEDVDEREAERIEPHARTVGRALWSPSTSAVDPREVMNAMCLQLRREGVAVCTSTRWMGTSTAANVQTDRGNVDAGYIVNAAGLHADRVARAYGFGDGYRMLPFRGVYLYGNQHAPALGVHVYPVPDLEMPFLGLHFTVTVNDRVKIGPTATPSAWREGYGLDADSLRRFSARDLVETAHAGAQMFASDPSFRRHAGAELRKLDRRYLVRSAGELVRGIRSQDFREWGPPGIRAQLFDERRGELVMDFRFQGDAQSMHVLNAVSPAFTCCLSFAEHLVDAIHALVG